METSEQETKELKRQLTVALDDSNQQKVEKDQLCKALEESAWQEEKSRLLEALEEEKDKVIWIPGSRKTLSITRATRYLKSIYLYSEIAFGATSKLRK